VTPDERIALLSNANATLRRKLKAAEEENALIGILASAMDGLRLELLDAKERLTRAHQLLEAVGLIDKLPPIAAPAEREQENDTRTPKAERGFT
jgi:hypothetical protein